MKSYNVCDVNSIEEMSTGCYRFTGGDTIEISDGYHTMHELYQHRMALNIALFHFWANDDYGRITVMKSKLHADGTMFEGYFIVMAVTELGQISYHYKLNHWDKFRINEVERTPIWDGHSSIQVLNRLMEL